MAWVFVKSQKKSLVLLVSIQLIIRSQAQMCAGAGLRCGGYGSAVVVTSSFAMVAVAEVLKKVGSDKIERISEKIKY